MQQAIQKRKFGYIILPRDFVAIKQKGVSSLTLRALRKTISREWAGTGAVEEIRTQRKR